MSVVVSGHGATVTCAGILEKLVASSRDAVARRLLSNGQVAGRAAMDWEQIWEPNAAKRAETPGMPCHATDTRTPPTCTNKTASTAQDCERSAHYPHADIPERCAPPDNESRGLRIPRSIKGNRVPPTQ